MAVGATVDVEAAGGQDGAATWHAGMVADAVAVAGGSGASGPTPARKEARDPGKRREKQRAAAAAARKRREEKGRDKQGARSLRRREPRPRDDDKGEESPVEPPALPKLESAHGTSPLLPAGAISSPPLRATTPAGHREAASSDTGQKDTFPAPTLSPAPHEQPQPEPEPAHARESTTASPACEAPSANVSKQSPSRSTTSITPPVISSPTELAAQCAVIQPALEAAMREVAKQRPAEPLHFLADRLVPEPGSLPAQDSASNPPPTAQQSVAGYLSSKVLPGVHAALLELFRHQPPVNDNAALAAEIMARVLRGQAMGVST